MNKIIIYVLIAYLFITNLVALMLMGIDKSKAKAGKWRIKERTLFISALIGGSIGANAGMQVFRHKTKHIQFVIGMPAILILHIVVAVLCVIYL